MSKKATTSECEVQGVVRELLQVCQEAGSGYELAAAGVSAANVRLCLEAFAAQRREFAKKLASAGAVDDAMAGNGKVSARLVESWLCLNDLTGFDGEAAILERCRECEENTLTVYDHALESLKGTSFGLQQTVQLQRGRIADILLILERMAAQQAAGVSRQSA